MSCGCKKKNSCTSVEVTSLPQAPNCNGVSMIQINGQRYQYNPSTCGGTSGDGIFTSLQVNGDGNITGDLDVGGTTTLQDLIVNGTSDFNGDVDFASGTTVDFTGVNVTGLPSSTVLQQGANVTITGTGTLANPYVINATGGSSSIGSLTNVTGITEIKMGTTPAMSGTTLVVTEPLATGTYNVNVNSNSVPNGFLQVTKGIGNFTITSTASESGLTFTYVIHKL